MARAVLGTAARWWSKDTVAVVTGSNKSLGKNIVLELARCGVTVVSTARDSKRGIAAVDSALDSEPELKDFIHFHQLDVTGEQSVADLASWLREKFGGIDILVNNAAIQKYSELYEDAVETLETNYFGVKRVTENLMPLLRSSPYGARVVMISSQVGQAQVFDSNEHAKTKIREALEHLDTRIVDSLAMKYLEDVKGGRATEGKWANNLHQYRESKLFLNAYTRVLAGQLSERPEGRKIYVAAICPGAMATDFLKPFFDKLDPETGEKMKSGVRWTRVEDAATTVVQLALLPAKEYPHGKFLIKKLEESTF